MSHIKLIAWYLYPDAWKILIDWQDMSKIALKSYYKHIWYFTQDPFVFNWTIKENLSYALGKLPNNDKIDKVLKLSKCGFVFDLPNWLDTEIGERRVRLSGWQKQRLAIAKIMLKDPEIIIVWEKLNEVCTPKCWSCRLDFNVIFFLYFFVINFIKSWYILVIFNDFENVG